MSSNPGLLKALLPFLLLLFILRVAGQLLVANGLAPFLPPMDQWQSGLLPYPLLVFFQILIIILYGKVSTDMIKERGTFYELQPRIKGKVRVFGYCYFASMIIRYIVYMSLNPEARWFSGTIPIFLHMVLATFLIIYAKFDAKPRKSS